MSCSSRINLDICPEWRLYILELQNDLVTECLINILKLWELEMVRMWKDSKLIWVKAPFSKFVERYVLCYRLQSPTAFWMEEYWTRCFWGWPGTGSPSCPALWQWNQSPDLGHHCLPCAILSLMFRTLSSSEATSIWNAELETDNLSNNGTWVTFSLSRFHYMYSINKPDKQTYHLESISALTVLPWLFG